MFHNVGWRFTFYGIINEKGYLLGAVAYTEYYTYDDYIQWDGDWELIDGHPYAMAPAPVITYQALAMQMAFEFERSMEDCPECIVAPEVDGRLVMTQYFDRM